MGDIATTCMGMCVLVGISAPANNVHRRHSSSVHASYITSICQHARMYPRARLPKRPQASVVVSACLSNHQHMSAHASMCPRARLPKHPSKRQQAPLTVHHRQCMPFKLPAYVSMYPLARPLNVNMHQCGLSSI